MKKEQIKREMIKEVQDLARQLGRTPKKLEYSKGKKAEYRFGTWNNFLEQAGLEPVNVQNYFINMSDEELLDRVKAEINRIGSTFAGEYQKHKSAKSPSRAYLEKRLKLTWNQILMELGFKSNIRRLTDDELIKELEDLAKAIGKSPTVDEGRTAGLNISVYETKFGSFNSALEAAGLDVNHQKETVTHTDDELLRMYIDLCNRLGKVATGEDINAYLKYSTTVFNIRFGGLNALRELAGFEKHKSYPKYSKASISRSLIAQRKISGRRLTNKEINQLSKDDVDFPSLSTILTYFKTTKMTVVWEEIEKMM